MREPAPQVSPVPEAAARPSAGLRWGLLVVALATVVAWYFIVNLRLPHTLGDEMYHIPTIRALAHGEPPPKALPMLRTYHWLLAVPARLTGDGLWALRAIEAVIAGLLILLYGALLRARYGPAGDSRLLLLAWNPLVFSFYALVYTDLASLLALLAAIYAHSRGRHWLAIGALLLACLIRQSNLVWVLFVALWRVLEWWSAQPAGPRAWRERVADFAGLIGRESLWLHATLLVVAAYVIKHWELLALSPVMENRAEFNPAQFYLFGLTLALLWLPLWGTRFLDWWSTGLRRALLRPAVCAAAVAILGFLFINYDSSHPWNTELQFLHNWPLHLMNSYGLVRFLAVLLIAVFAATQARTTAGHPARALLILVWGASLVFLFPHYPVDARYYIIPIVLLDFFTPYERPQVRCLTAWYFVLMLGVGYFIASRPTHFGGL